MIRIVADAAIPWSQEAFAQLGHLTELPGASITRGDLRGAEVLLVRSVTRVDAPLLEGLGVRMVASATSGVDHVDVEALRRLGIAFAHAPGCNATAVVEYVLAAVCGAAAEDPALDEGPFGIVGYGQIGSRLADRCRRLGREVLVCDPPWLERHDPCVTDPPFVGLEELCRRCSVVSVHVPMIRSGRHRTRHMFDAQALAWLRRGALLVNTSRGAVVSAEALEAWLDAGGGTAVLDVWEHEPSVRWSLFERPGLVLATPHIAGYTLEGKAAATLAVHRAVSEFLGRRPWFSTDDVIGRPLGDPSLERATSALEVLRTVHPLATCDAHLRRVAELDAPQRPSAFERLRSGYRFRRELSHFSLPAAAADSLALRRLWPSGP